MSERTNPEIEDVLASIRRLVSEDVKEGGPRRRAAERLSEPDPEPGPEPAPSAPEALVLTPDFRVPNTTAKEADAVPPDRADLSRIECAIDDLEAAIDAGEDSVGVPWEADGSEGDRWSEAADVPLGTAGEDTASVMDGDPVTLPAIEPSAEDAELVEEDRQDEAEASPAGKGQDTPPINEATLRGLVGDILREELSGDILHGIVSDAIRQELQGPLGERITRNVRKLVRREINQALAAREFD